MKPNDSAGLLDGYFSPDELARELDVALETLKRWHRVGAGPPVTKIGRHRYYAREGVMAWLKSREQKAGSQYAIA